jgi:diamine N-acetyltransferase
VEPLTLTPTTSADLPFALAAERDPEARRHVVAWPRERHLAAIAAADEAHLLVRVGGDPVGFVLLAGLRSPHRAVELRRLVVTRRGEGLGRRALDAALRLAFAEHGAHRVWLDVKVHNARARRLYARAGFVEEGVLRDALLTGGRFESLVVMSVLRPEWERRRTAGRD